MLFQSTLKISVGCQAVTKLFGLGFVKWWKRDGSEMWVVQVRWVWCGSRGFEAGEVQGCVWYFENRKSSDRKIGAIN